MKLTLNTFIDLIDKSKKRKTGNLGRGRLCVRLIDVICDPDSLEGGREQAIINKFNFKLPKKDAYAAINVIIHKFIKSGNGYPYELINMDNFEKCIGTSRYNVYISKMHKFCDDFLDKSKYEALIYTLLEILQHDDSITVIPYGDNFIPKEHIFGSYAHPKKICLEALLLGLLYHTHKNPAFEKISELLPIPDRLKFHLVRYNNEDSLNTEIELNLKDTISQNAMRPYAIEEAHTSLNDKIYSVQILNEDNLVSDIPHGRNIFIYGSGGMGKTTYLLDMIKNNQSEKVYFYFPLYKYKNVFLQKIQSESCYFLSHILLKYLYQYEYHTIESCLACEGEDTLIRQLSELSSILKNNPDGWEPQYILLLDGMNELSAELQEALADELEYINNEWKNVRFIITGRNIPAYDVLSDYEKIEIRGISEQTLEKALPDYENLKTNANLIDVLKNPMFLNIYIENHIKEAIINTHGEILDYYIENYEINTTYDKKTVRFIVNYALPFAAKLMTDRYSHEIDRSDLSEAIDKAFEFYISNERIYQNFIAPEGIRKNALLESRDKYDFVELLIENLCFLTVSKFEPQKVHFTHQYFRDYFVAKYIINMISALEASYNDYHIKEKAEMFDKYDLGFIWFNDDDFEIYRLIGEIAGDYKNTYNDDFIYHRTILDMLLDMSRQFNTFRTTENVIKAMSAVRGNIICGVDFRNTSLPYSIPRHLKFSSNGDYPCDFRECMVAIIDILYDYDGHRNYEIYSCILDERITPEIVAGFDNFKGCDFRGAKYAEIDYKKFLNAMGAITD